MSLLNFALSYLLVDAVASLLVLTVLYRYQTTIKYRVREFLGINDLAARLEVREFVTDERCEHDIHGTDCFECHQQE